MVGGGRRGRLKEKEEEEVDCQDQAEAGEEVK